jgi:hypothetical protein
METPSRLSSTEKKVINTSLTILNYCAMVISFLLRDSWLQEQKEEDNQQSYIHTETCPHTLASAAKVMPYVLSDVGGQE